MKYMSLLEEITPSPRRVMTLFYIIDTSESMNGTRKTAVERNNIFATIRRYAKKLKPQYNGDVYLETVRCYFDIPQENLEKCRYTYQGNETYAFLMSDKYIMALYTHCLVARKKAAMEEIQIEGFTEKEYGMVRLRNVGDVLFQALLLDNVRFEDDKICTEFCTCFWGLGKVRQIGI